MSYPVPVNGRFITGSRRFSLFASAFVMFVGALVLAGWLVDIYRLKSIYGDITMKANAALSLLLAGTSLWALNLDNDKAFARRAGQVCAAMVALVGALTLSQHIFGWNLGIDQLLFTEPPGALATTSPGRMGPPASSCFTLYGIALLLLYTRRAVSLAQFLSTVVCLWALLAIIGYTYQAEQLYGVARYTGIAFPTAVSFFLLGLGLLAARVDQGLTSVITSGQAGGLMARRLLITAVSVPVLLGWLRLSAQRAGYYDLGFGTAALVLAIIIIFTLVIWQSAAKLNHIERQRLTAESTVRENEEGARQQAALIELSYEPIFVWNLDDGIVDWNKGCEQLYGYSREEAVTRVSHQLLNTRPPLSLDTYRQTLLREGYWSGELRHTTRDGHEVVVESRQQLIESRGQRLVLETNRNITERKKAEEALRASENQLRLVTDNIPVFIVYCDTERRYQFVNKAYAQRFGVSPEEIIGKSIPEVVGEQAYANFRQYVDAALDGQSVEFEVEVPYESIGRRHMLCAYTPDVDSDGKVKGFYALISDTTERKLAEQAVRESEERMQLAMVIADAGTWDIDLAGGKTIWSQSHFAILGYEPNPMGEVDYRMWQERVHPDDLENALTEWQRAERERDLYQCEHRIVRADNGEVHWLDTIGRFYYDGAGKAVRFVGVFFDITERKRGEEEREHLLAREQGMRAEAERANRLKDEFLATVSHEIRTPLNAILGWATMLQSGKIDKALAARAIETIERNARSQARLIEDLLDVSRIISGKLRLEVRPNDLRLIINAAIDSVHPAAAAKEIQLQTVLDPAASHIQGDAARLQQVVWNLLSNAVKFTPRGGLVQVRLDRTDSKAQITVSDTGEGINTEFLPYVFDRFQQADGTTTRKHGGLGLGLAIVRHIVEMHGGTIEAFSRGVGQGASFAVRLPLVAVRATGPLPSDYAESASHGESSTATDSTILHGLRILAVDDQPDARYMLKGVLEQYGADVVTAASAREAFEALPGLMPDVLVCDIGMPEEDGHSLIKRIRELKQEQGGNTPAIALTGYVRVEERMRALAAGYQMFVPKPVEAAELASIIASLVGRTDKGIGA